MGKFNGRHSGTLLPAESFTKPKNFTFPVTFAFAVLSSNLSSLSVRTTVVVKTKGEVWVHQNSRFWAAITFPPTSVSYFHSATLGAGRPWWWREFLFC